MYIDTDFLTDLFKVLCYYKQVPAVKFKETFLIC